MLFVYLFQQKFCCEIMISECVQERARYCKYSVLFGLSEGNPSYLCFVRVSDRRSLFPGGPPLLGSRAGSAGGLRHAGGSGGRTRSKSCLPSPGAFCTAGPQRCLA